MIKYLLSRICHKLLGRRNYYRLARYLWLDARRDRENVMSRNGEQDVQNAIAGLAKGRSSVVLFDISANIGKYTETLLRALNNSGVESFRHFCFEPNPACVEAIQTRLEQLPNGSSVEVIPKTVSDQSGTVAFYVTGETAGSSSLRIDEKKQQGTRIEAECLTLDSFCMEREINEILFAKVDTEGNDMRVLMGMKELIESGRLSYLQFEYNHRWILFRNFLKEVFELVQPHGYQIAKVTSEGLEVYPSWHFELEVFWEGNYLIGKDLRALGLPLLKSAIFLSAH